MLRRGLQSSATLFSNHLKAAFTHPKFISALPAFEMVQFDVAGSLTDKYCKGPFKPFELAFLHKGFALTPQQIVGPMGTDKKNHIRILLEEIKNEWIKKNGKAPSQEDVNEIYDYFLENLVQYIPEHTELTPFAAEMLDALEQNKVPVALTSGYPRVAADLATKKLLGKFNIPYTTTADEVKGSTRIAMVRKNHEKAGLNPNDLSRVVLFTDARSDIESTRGCTNGPFVFGISHYSTHVGIRNTEEEKSISKEELAIRQEKAHQYLLAAKPHAVIRDLSEAPLALIAAKQALERGLKPEEILSLDIHNPAKISLNSSISCKM